MTDIYNITVIYSQWTLSEVMVTFYSVKIQIISDIRHTRYQHTHEGVVSSSVFFYFHPLYFPLMLACSIAFIMAPKHYITWLWNENCIPLNCAHHEDEYSLLCKISWHERWEIVLHKSSVWLQKCIHYESGDLVNINTVRSGWQIVITLLDKLVFTSVLSPDTCTLRRNVSKI